MLALALPLSAGRATPSMTVPATPAPPAARTALPGTLAAEVDEHEILIHALEAASITSLDRGGMRQRVERLHH